jgi:hypothetical protein
MEKSHILKKILRGQFQGRRLVMKARKILGNSAQYSAARLIRSEQY